jgi:hypothetical protein
MKIADAQPQKNKINGTRPPKYSSEKLSAILGVPVRSPNRRKQTNE